MVFVLARMFMPASRSSSRFFTAARPTAFSNLRNNATRGYRRQAFNYQTFQSTSGLFRRWAARPTFYYEIGGIGVLCSGFYVSNLETVPVSGRRRFNVLSAEREKAMGESMYQQTMQEYGNKIMPAYTHEHRLVSRVLSRLIPASGLEGEDWEIHVINENIKNAFVIPGGKVFVFKGILDVAQGEDGLAAVLGHEIAHNVAHHAAERMSQSFIFLPVAIIGSMLLGIDPGIGKMGADIAFSLPGSRKQEAEADYIGLLMMAESCYDPRAAMGLWARMEQDEHGRAPPPFLSTHPSSHNRLEKIREWLPQAQEKLAASECGTISGFVDDFRQKFDMAGFGVSGSTALVSRSRNQ
ncbi:Hypothetical protein R9X50_00563100 [Acrodontium crateriforme]|uniref:Peptidase M48 domain-containing protein n=1 Tax=Acrodontium crateriforme TaxID=150365 RepID=A0AAQ3M895_9PEZI|nr:Hypothetical protein R9X50_00563100 [Acrodontium crateriforme]